jgi:hypothetical protein
VTSLEVSGRTSLYLWPLNRATCAAKAKQRDVASERCRNRIATYQRTKQVAI